MWIFFFFACLRKDICVCHAEKGTEIVESGLMWPTYPCCILLAYAHISDTHTHARTHARQQRDGQGEGYLHYLHCVLCSPLTVSGADQMVVIDTQTHTHVHTHTHVQTHKRMFDGHSWMIMRATLWQTISISGTAWHVVYGMKQTSYRNDATETDKKYSTAGNRSWILALSQSPWNIYHVQKGNLKNAGRVMHVCLKLLLLHLSAPNFSSKDNVAFCSKWFALPITL